MEYCIRVSISAGSLTSDIFVDLPIRIINFLSIDTVSPFSISPIDPSSRPPSEYNYHENTENGVTRSGSFLNSDKVDDPSVTHNTSANDSIVDYAEDHASTHDLGNLDEAHNSDEEVDLVVGTALVDQGENAMRFSSDPLNKRSSFDRDSSPPLIEKETMTHGHVGSERRRRRTTSHIPFAQGQPTSFSMRVQEKLANVERATTAKHDDHSDVDPATPKAPASKLSGVHQSVVNSDGSATLSCSSSVPKQRPEIAGQAVTAFLSGVDFHIDSRTNLGATRKQAPNDGNVEVEEGTVVKKTMVMDKTSDVKKRIEALEAKMRNAV